MQYYVQCVNWQPIFKYSLMNDHSDFCVSLGGPKKLNSKADLLNSDGQRLAIIQIIGNYCGMLKNK